MYIRKLAMLPDIRKVFAEPHTFIMNPVHTLEEEGKEDCRIGRHDCVIQNILEQCYSTFRQILNNY